MDYQINGNEEEEESKVFDDQIIRLDESFEMDQMEFEEECELKAPLKQSTFEDYSPVYKAKSENGDISKASEIIDDDYYTQFNEGVKPMKVKQSSVNSPDHPLKLIDYISQNANRNSFMGSCNTSFKESSKSRP